MKAVKYIPLIVLFATLISRADSDSVSFYGYEKYNYSEEVWVPDFQVQSKDPYGGFMLQEFLAERFESRVVRWPFSESVEAVPYGDGDYVYVIYGYDLHLRRKDYYHMLDFVEEGNTVVIIAEYVPDHLLRRFFSSPWIVERKNSLLTVQATGDTTTLEYHSNFKTESYPWRLLDPASVKDRYAESFTDLSQTDNGLSNLLAIEYGKGKFYFCSTPIAFSNKELKTAEGYRFFEHFFSRFLDKVFIVDAWMSYELLTVNTSDGTGSRDSDIDSMEASTMESPISYILGNRALTWAYFLLLVTGILYLVYRGKRRQKVVKLTAHDENASLAFVETVSTLYLSKKQHKSVVLQKRKNLMHFIRTHYFISGSKVTKQYLMELEKRSGVDPTLINRIFEGFEMAEKRKQVSTEHLLQLHADVETFYKTCI